jgi:hypothetical protein
MRPFVLRMRCEEQKTLFVKLVGSLALQTGMAPGRGVIGGKLGFYFPTSPLCPIDLAILCKTSVGLSRAGDICNQVGILDYKIV